MYASTDALLPLVRKSQSIGVNCSEFSFNGSKIGKELMLNMAINKKSQAK